MKTFELQGAALDWAVKEIEDGRTDGIKNYSPSTNWSEGGPIIEREKITPQWMDNGYWRAWQERVAPNKLTITYGPTPLIAAMRCYVASKLGDEVEIPEEMK